MSDTAASRWEETVLNLVLLRGLARWTKCAAEEMLDSPHRRRRLRGEIRARVERMVEISYFFSGPPFCDLSFGLGWIVQEVRRPRLFYDEVHAGAQTAYAHVPDLDEDGEAEAWGERMAEAPFFGAEEPTWSSLVSEVPFFAEFSQADLARVLFDYVVLDSRLSSAHARLEFGLRLADFLSKKEIHHA